MNIVLPIPDDLARRLEGEGGTLERRALEAFALAEYRADRLTDAEMCHLLGFDTRMTLDAFLGERGVFLDYTLHDLDRERRDLARLGF